MENMVQIRKGTANNSIIIEQLELFTEEKNIQPIINVLNLVLNTPGYINIDFADINSIANSNNTYSVNYTKIKKSDEISLTSKEFRPKGGVISISAPQTTTTLDMVDEFINIIKQNFDDDAVIIFGISFSDNLSEIEAEIIEFR